MRFSATDDSQERRHAKWQYSRYQMKATRSFLISIFLRVATQTFGRLCVEVCRLQMTPATKQNINHKEPATQPEDVASLYGSKR